MNDLIAILKLVLIVATATASAHTAMAQPLMIRLRPVVEMTHRTVRLADVAKLSILDSTAVPEKLRLADLAKIPETARFTLIDKSVIDVRLRLLGLQQHEYRLLGPEQIIVSLVENVNETSRDPRFSLTASTTQVSPVSMTRYAEPVSDSLIERAVQSSLARQFGLEPDAVKAQLLRPFIDERQREQQLSAHSRIEVVAPSDFPFGRANLTVQFWEGDRLRSSRTVFVDVRRRQNVLVARKTLGRTSTISVDDVAQEKRFVDSRRDELQFADVSGLSPSKTIRPGEILTLGDFPLRSQQQSEELIRPRDAVRIIGHRKSLQFVVPAAEAMQSGRMGQLIRVKNLHSNKIVIGRVTGRGEVEVPLE